MASFGEVPLKMLFAVTTTLHNKGHPHCKRRINVLTMLLLSPPPNRTTFIREIENTPPLTTNKKEEKTGILESCLSTRSIQKAKRSKKTTLLCKCHQRHVILHYTPTTGVSVTTTK
jgi:hypothetical protein